MGREMLDVSCGGRRERREGGPRDSGGKNGEMTCRRSRGKTKKNWIEYKRKREKLR